MIAGSFVNKSGETVPAYGVIQVSGAERVPAGGKRTSISGTKPSGQTGVYWINGPSDIPYDATNLKTGSARRALKPVWALYETTDGTPAFGQMWGPELSGWKLRKGNPGFVVVGDPTDGKVLVLEDFSGEATGGEGFPPGDDCNCGNCYEGDEIPDGTICCESHLRWQFLTSSWGFIDLHYAGSDTWESDDEFAFVCYGGTNSYKWRLTPSRDPAVESKLELVLVDDQGCDQVLVTYIMCCKWNCLCENKMTLCGGDWANISRDTLDTNVCVKPHLSFETIPSDEVDISACRGESPGTTSMRFPNQAVVFVKGFSGHASKNVGSIPYYWTYDGSSENFTTSPCYGVGGAMMWVNVNGVFNFQRPFLGPPASGALLSQPFVAGQRWGCTSPIDVLVRHRMNIFCDFNTLTIQATVLAVNYCEEQENGPLPDADVVKAIYEKDIDITGLTVQQIETLLHASHELSLVAQVPATPQDPGCNDCSGGDPCGTVDLTNTQVLPATVRVDVISELNPWGGVDSPTNSGNCGTDDYDYGGGSGSCGGCDSLPSEATVSISAGGCPCASGQTTSATLWGIQYFANLTCGDYTWQISIFCNPNDNNWYGQVWTNGPDGQWTSGAIAVQAGGSCEPLSVSFVATIPTTNTGCTSPGTHTFTFTE